MPTSARTGRTPGSAAKESSPCWGSPFSERVLSRLATVRSASASARRIGRSGAAGSSGGAAAVTPRSSMMSPATVRVVTLSGSGPSVRIGYAAGLPSGCTPSTTAARTQGRTWVAGTTATALRSRVTRARESTTRSRSSVPSIAVQRVVRPDSMRLRRAAGIRISPRLWCATSTRGWVVDGSGAWAAVGELPAPEGLLVAGCRRRWLALGGAGRQHGQGDDGAGRASYCSPWTHAVTVRAAPTTARDARTRPGAVAGAGLVGLRSVARHFCLAK